MTEEQIINGIRATTDKRGLASQLRKLHLMQDHLHAVQDGEIQAREEWVNFSSVLFPEDFEDAMNQLDSDLAPIVGQLKQLDRIEAAIKHQLESAS
jgi:hypothetical protein